MVRIYRCRRTIRRCVGDINIQNEYHLVREDMDENLREVEVELGEEGGSFPNPMQVAGFLMNQLPSEKQDASGAVRMYSTLDKTTLGKPYIHITNKGFEIHGALHEVEDFLKIGDYMEVFLRHRREDH